MEPYPTFECPAIDALFIEKEVNVSMRWERSGFVTTIIQVEGLLASREALQTYAEHEHEGVIEARVNGVRYEVFYERPDLAITRYDNLDEVLISNPRLTLTTHARLERRIHPVVVRRNERKKREQEEV